MTIEPGFNARTMYNDGMVKDIRETIRKAMSGQTLFTREDFLDRLFSEMAEHGVHPMWIDHSLRVGDYAAKVAGNFSGQLGIQEFELPLIQTAGNVHDIGNILGFVGENGAYKSLELGKLTDRELEGLKLHPVIGCEYLGILDPDGEFINNAYVRGGVRSHHESIDGSGYPDGLAGREIPNVARLLRIADMIDSAADPYHPRLPGRTTLSFGKIMDELQTNAGILYDKLTAAMFYLTLDDSNTREYLRSHPSEIYFKHSPVLV